MAIYFLKGLCIGLMAGLVYFLGLWWTVRRLPDSKRPGRLWFGSFICRIVTLGGLLVLVAGNMAPVYVGAALGFYLARLLVSNFCRPAEALPLSRGPRHGAQEVRNAASGE